jgi:hypothetical protein
MQLASCALEPQRLSATVAFDTGLGRRNRDTAESTRPMHKKVSEKFFSRNGISFIIVRRATTRV